MLVIGPGIAMRLALIAAGGSPERFEYDDLARNVLSGRGYDYDQLGTPYRSFYAGLVLGLALFQRGSMAVFFVGTLAWLMVFLTPAAYGQTGRIVVAYVAGLVLVIAPWAARNYAIHGMVMLESMTPQQFWKGNAT